jgi:cation transport ATPase
MMAIFFTFNNISLAESSDDHKGHAHGSEDKDHGHSHQEDEKKSKKKKKDKHDSHEGHDHHDEEKHDSHEGHDHHDEEKHTIMKVTMMKNLIKVMITEILDMEIMEVLSLGKEKEFLK